MIQGRDKVSEDAHQCIYCVDFGYASFITCSRCKVHYCIKHAFMCGCAAPHVHLQYRFSNYELADYLRKIESAVEARRV